jgi:hypothetical protein
MTPVELSKKRGITPKRVRDIIRANFGHLDKQARGPRWILSRAEIEMVRRQGGAPGLGKRR